MENTQSYTHEFKSEAVKLVLTQGLSLAEAAKRLSIPKGTLTGWVSNAKGGAVAAPGSRSVPELEAAARQLRKELAEARMERDILKKATAYFAKESLQGMRS
jgi:transposase